MQKLPHKISLYITQHFPEGYLADIKTIEGEDGQISYKIDVNEYEDVYHLEFNEEGILIKHVSEPLYDEDYYEGSYYGAADED